jgi:hypothetical protein
MDPGRVINRPPANRRAQSWVAIVTWLRPSSFDRYNAASARAMRSSAVSDADGIPVAAPTLMVTIPAGLSTWS